MLPDLPLHPAVVHLPIGLTVILPFLTLGLWFFFSKKMIPKSVLVLILFFQFLLSGSSYFAIQTGENEEELVAQVVGEEPIERHEEKAEFFYTWTLVVAFSSLALIASLSSAKMSWGFSIILVLQLVTIYLMVDLSHTGGELVYKHGAAEAYERSKD